MLKKRLIPKILIKKVKIRNKSKLLMVTSNKFKHYKVVGDPVSQAKIYESQKSDELIILFIDRKLTFNNSETINLIRDLASKTFMPLTIGGNVKSIKDFETLLSNGADKVSINSIVYSKPELINKAAKKFGSQCVVVSVDFIEKNKEIFLLNKNIKKFFKVNLQTYLQKLISLGAGEILLTDINRDGSESGLNINIAKNLSTNLDVPLIISGGCNSSKDFINCFKNSEVEGISAGNFFAFKDQNPIQTRSQILNSKIKLRK
ncbi:HisA/HisF-related TIM barrel protein [Candidatus Pelagibacter sp.]|nr:HisA/HisF-related TIM barrel protein [Candidatus Pelagibacter sp.]MDC3158078.1 HisA/HisF-related TIM barrel protein [Candidatus Pelagibacter sp.]